MHDNTIGDHFSTQKGKLMYKSVTVYIHKSIRLKQQKMSVECPIRDLIKQKTGFYETAIIHTKCDTADNNFIITTTFIQKPSLKARRASA